jgi:hypothetical protein
MLGARGYPRERTSPSADAGSALYAALPDDIAAALCAMTGRSVCAYLKASPVAGALRMPQTLWPAAT